MTLAELISRYRILANDKAAPFFVSDDEARDFLNEAENQACIRGRMIHAADDAEVCDLVVSAGRALYEFHPSLIEIDNCCFRENGAARRGPPIEFHSQEWLDDCVQDWRDKSGAPRYAILNDTSIRLVPRPAVGGLLIFEGYRAPKRPMSKTTDSPEIARHHHEHLVQWALFRAFSIPDSEFIDPTRAAAAESAFAAYFGPLVDVDLRRLTREDFPHVTRSFMP
mgnify:FL=1